MLEEETKVKFTHLQAVVLAAGRGSRLMDLTNKTPKCLLQVGTYPMVWYPLHMLEQAGFEDVILIVAESQKSRIYDTLTNKYSLGLGLDLVGIPASEDWGTADSLRYIAPKIKTDILVVSCDLICDYDLYKLADVYRTNQTAITALFAPIPPELKETAVPGYKGKQKIERDFIGMAPGTSRLVYIKAEADCEETLSFSKGLLKRHPHVMVHSNLMDAHLYIMRKWTFDYLVDNKQFTALKGEVVPYLVKKQFSKPPKQEDVPSNMSLVEEKISKKTDIFSYAAQDETPFTEWSNTAGANTDPIRCHAVVMSEGICLRANNLAGYCEANRQIYRQWSSLIAEVPLTLLHPRSIIKNKSQIGGDCIVGDGAEISDKVSIKRCVIGQHCKIGEKVRMVNCVLMGHITISEGCTVTGSIICDNTTLEERCEIKDCIVAAEQTIPKGSKHVSEVLADRDRWMEI